MRRILVFLVCLFGVGLLSARDVWAAPGTVDVQLVNRTAGSVARLGDIEVRLFAFAGNQRVYEETLMTADEGLVRFAGLDVAPEQTWIVSVLFQGVVYVTHGQSFTAEQDTLRVEVPVYESTGDASALSIESSHIVVTSSEKGAGFDINEVLALKNGGDKTVLGGKDSSITLGLDVPDGIKDFHVVEGLLERHVAQGDGLIAITGPLHPGSQQVVFQYHVPAAEGWFFRRRFNVPVASVDVFTPETGPAILSNQLVPGEPLDLEGKRYKRYATRPGAAEEGIRFEVGGVGAVDRSSETGQTAALVGAGVLALVTLVFLVRPLLVPAPRYLVLGGRLVSKEEARRIVLERERDARLEAVREIEFDFETGKLSREDYEPLRAKYKAEAMAVLLELDRLGGPAAPETTAAPVASAGVPTTPVGVPAGAANFCSACGAALRPIDRFCSRCGTAVQPPAEGSAPVAP